uniref:NADH dehydrogenase subunit 6 n=1 Tax=Bactrothrips quadrituberculatus TaxID=1246465 RepID=A0A8E5JZK1_9NEOP|nr:NADH dehydrogenase subunit 6 [Bactrothrips quadrituberculatus]QVD42815.1 NADH dehydrogenase subunit 6 [Bactrothrips quadrituberculatus]
MSFFLNFLFFFLLIFIMLFCFMDHPLVMGLFLILLTLVLSIYSIFISFSSWNGYILFLMFLGGLLILFLYNISLISTEMFSLKFSFLFLFFGFIFLCNVSFIKETLSEEVLYFFLLKNTSSLNVLMKFFNMSMILFLVFYLFFSLVCIINVVYMNKDKGSLWMY